MPSLFFFNKKNDAAPVLSLPELILQPNIHKVRRGLEAHLKQNIYGIDGLIELALKDPVIRRVLESTQLSDFWLKHLNIRQSELKEPRYTKNLPITPFNLAWGIYVHVKYTVDVFGEGLKCYSQDSVNTLLAAQASGYLPILASLNDYYCYALSHRHTPELTTQAIANLRLATSLHPIAGQTLAAKFYQSLAQHPVENSTLTSEDYWAIAYEHFLTFKTFVSKSVSKESLNNSLNGIDVVGTYKTRYGTWEKAAEAFAGHNGLSRDTLRAIELRVDAFVNRTQKPHAKAIDPEIPAFNGASAETPSHAPSMNG